MKANSEYNYIRKICSVKYSHFRTEEKQYQHPRQCDIHADMVLSQLHEGLRTSTKPCDRTEEGRDDCNKLVKIKLDLYM